MRLWFVVLAVFSDAMATGQVEEAPFVRYARGGAMPDTLLLQPVAASGGYMWIRGFFTSDEVPEPATPSEGIR